MRRPALLSAAALAAGLALTPGLSASAVPANSLILDKTFHFRTGERLTGGGGTGPIILPVSAVWHQNRPELICEQNGGIGGPDDPGPTWSKTSAPWIDHYDYTLGSGNYFPGIWNVSVSNRTANNCAVGQYRVGDGKTYYLPAPIQETSRNVTYSGTGWTSQSSTGYAGNSAKLSSTAGDKVTFTYSGTSSAFVTNSGGPTGYGTANVYIDGVKKATIDLKGSATQKWRYVGFDSYTDVNSSHTLTVEVVSGQIVADAFLYAAPWTGQPI